MGLLIEVDELAEALAGEAPPVVADVRWSLTGPPGRSEFSAGHIPGAQYVDLETELTGPAPSPSGPGGRHPLPAPDVFEAAMRRIGVDPNSSVVIYDDANALAGARLWWLLSDAGHDRVRILNGGLRAWRNSGRQMETGPAAEVPPGRFQVRPGQRTRVDAETLIDRLGRPDASPLVDVRGYERYTGQSEPMDPVAGHIPGAVSAPSMANLGADGRFLAAGEIVDRYRELDAAGEPVFYCGSGITAAHTLLAREAAGLSGGVIYPGSWSDWISDPGRPVATGDGQQL